LSLFFAFLNSHSSTLTDQNHALAIKAADAQETVFHPEIPACPLS
jgi:hypothetical protein